jgi:hypothetical protein
MAPIFQSAAPQAEHTRLLATTSLTPALTTYPASMIHGKQHCKPHGLLIRPLALAHACCNARHLVFHMLNHALQIFQPWQGLLSRLMIVLTNDTKKTLGKPTAMILYLYFHVQSSLA